MSLAKSELNYYPEEFPKVKKVKKVKKKPRSNSGAKLFLIFLAMTGLGISVGILSRYAKITSIRGEITRIQREQENYEKEKVVLSAELEGIKSSKTIEEDAILKLGMDYPLDNQRVYINIKDNQVEPEDLGIMSKLTRFLSETLDYFRG